MGDLGTGPFPDISQTQPIDSTYVGVEEPKRRGSLGLPGVDPTLPMDFGGGAWQKAANCWNTSCVPEWRFFLCRGCD